MRTLILVARILLGLMFTVFGLNFFFHFLPQPPPPPAAGAFAGALLATGYIFYLLKVLEVASGLALLSGFFVPLALTVLAPIIVNILFFHAFLAPAGLPLPLVILVLELFLAWAYREAFRPVLNPRAQPKG
jgi:putative oxidoreductase